jgi:quinoprotein glucose dehydrogenase
LLDIGLDAVAAAIYWELLIAPSMDRLVRAGDTGALAWTFNLVPQPGEPGHDTWEERGVENHWRCKRLGATSPYTLGLAFVPTAPRAVMSA